MIQSDLCLRQALHIFEISRSPHKFNNNLLIDFLIKEYKGRIEFEGDKIDEKQSQNEQKIAKSHPKQLSLKNLKKFNEDL